MSPHDDFENRPETESGSASSQTGGDFQISRPDWTLFRSLGTLGQKAGVPVARLRRLCLKELVDNSLDAGAHVTIEEPVPGRYVIEDDGRGFLDKTGKKPATPQEIAALFSIDRDLVTSKLWRKPQRGALGNGLRVVAGAVIASRGKLVVTTNNQRLTITPHATGGTSVDVKPARRPTGTRIEISFGPDMPQDANALAWGAGAITMAEGGAGYSGNTSAYWFDADAFYELVHGAGERPVRALIEKFDGCSGAKAGEVAAQFLQRSCGSLTRNETRQLLRRAREMTTPVSAARLGAVGKLDVLPRHYARQDSIVELGVEPKAHVPFIVEAWAENAHGKGASSTITVCINRTPVTGNTQVFFDSDKDFMIYGCGLHHAIDTPTKKGAWRLTLNVTAPYVPITTDGKEPDLEPAVDAIRAALAAAIWKAHRNAPKKETIDICDVVFDSIEEAVADVSDNGKHRFAQRQLLYALRPIVMAETGRELKTANFDKNITEYEAMHGPIPGMYRDNRGGLYQPHTDDDSDIPVGTLMVEAYERPPWTFNKIVYIEKQGYFEVLKAEKWPERHDCALLTSKGYSSRAVRDLIDRLVEHDEPVQVFCVHDADAAGTMIMQTLQEETAARGARQIEIINLGLEPWEAEEMGLEAEEFEESNKRRPVADYVLAREDGEHWGEWLQSNRYELNAMTTRQILDWLDAKMAEHGVGKVVPPQEVIAEETAARLEAELRKRITERVLREADLDALVAKAMTEITVPEKLLTRNAVEAWLDDSEQDGWRDCVEETVQRALVDREV